MSNVWQYWLYMCSHCPSAMNLKLVFILVVAIVVRLFLSRTHKRCVQTSAQFQNFIFFLFFSFLFRCGWLMTEKICVFLSLSSCLHVDELMLMPLCRVCSIVDRLFSFARSLFLSLSISFSLFLFWSVDVFVSFLFLHFLLIRPRCYCIGIATQILLMNILCKPCQNKCVSVGYSSHTSYKSTSSHCFFFSEPTQNWNIDKKNAIRTFWIGQSHSKFTQK